MYVQMLRKVFCQKTVFMVVTVFSIKLAGKSLFHWSNMGVIMLILQRHWVKEDVMVTSPPLVKEDVILDPMGSLC